MRIFLVLGLLLLAALPGWAAPMFDGGAPSQEARDAAAYLVARGLLEGYPDGTFKGDRAISRFELVDLLDRIPPPGPQAAQGADLDDLNRVVQSLRAELEALGGRVQSQEEAVERTEKREENLARPRL